MTQAFKTCPICKKPVDKAFEPFCSKRCADLDLGKWLGGDYRIPGEEVAKETPKGEDDQG